MNLSIAAVCGMFLAAILAVSQAQTDRASTKPSRITDLATLEVTDATMVHFELDQQAYIECFMVPAADRSVSPYAAMSFDTQQALTHSPGHQMQGCAAWHLSVFHASQAQWPSAKWTSLVAAEAINTPIPVVELWKNYLVDQPNSIAYIVWAETRWPEQAYLRRLSAHLTSAERAAALTDAQIIEGYAVQARELVQ